MCPVSCKNLFVVSHLCLELCYDTAKNEEMKQKNEAKLFAKDIGGWKDAGAE